MNALLHSNRGAAILQELGLTSAQARTYMALCRLPNASTAKTISASANITRQDIYQILAQLQQLSLVEVIFAKPVLYRPTPIRQTIAMLAERRRQKTDALLSEAQRFISSYGVDKQTEQEEIHQFLLIPKKETCIQRIKKTINLSSLSIALIAPWRETTQWLFTMHEPFKHALDRNVEIRCLSQEQKKTKFPRGLVELFNYSNFELRLMSEPCNVRFAVYDDHEAFFATSDSEDAAESPALWTSNPAIVHVLKHYFETKWALAKNFKVE
jgi:sugar-specific transcriptional regulator TrmB